MAEELKQVSGIELLVSEKVKDIEAQREAVKAEYGPLTGIATTPENLAERKKDKAAISKKKKAINDERIAFEKKWKEAIAPITDAYKGVTGLLGLYEDDLKETLEEFEVQRIQAKKERIKEIFETAEKAPEVSGWVSLDSIYKTKWENATCSEKDIQAEIQQVYDQMKISYDNVVGMNHPYQEEGLKTLRETGDFMKAVARMNELSEQQRIIEERQKAAAQAETDRLRFAAEAQEKARQEEELKRQSEMSIRERAEDLMNRMEEGEEPQKPAPVPASLPFGMPTLVPAYVVTCTCMSSFELEMLKHILDEKNIKYTIEKEMVDYGY